MSGVIEVKAGWVCPPAEAMDSTRTAVLVWTRE